MENMNNMNNYENDNMQNWQQQEELPSYQREISRRQYNVLIGAHLLYGLALTAFLCLKLPYIFPQVYSVHPVIFSYLPCGRMDCQKGKLPSIYPWLHDECSVLWCSSFFDHYVLSGSSDFYCGCIDLRSGFNHDGCCSFHAKCVSLYGKGTFHCFNRLGSG